MTLTTAQIVILKAAIIADSTLNAQPRDGNGNGFIADAMNAIASPDFWVWKTVTTLHDIQNDPGWDWTRVDNLSVGKARIWEWMFDQVDSIPSSLANYRIGITSVWVGTAADLLVQAAVLAVCRRKASRVEKLLATGTGSTAVPATMGFEGQISSSDVDAARN